MGESSLEGEEVGVFPGKTKGIYLTCVGTRASYLKCGRPAPGPANPAASAAPASSSRPKEPRHWAKVHHLELLWFELFCLEQRKKHILENILSDWGARV